MSAAATDFTKFEKRITENILKELAPAFVELASAVTGEKHVVRKSALASRQVDEERERRPINKSAPVKYGQGLFKDVIFGASK
jgi:hypothetical protein